MKTCKSDNIDSFGLGSLYTFCKADCRSKLGLQNTDFLKVSHRNAFNAY
ncbi:uncharacterized protein PgNI_09517 [Pyricularia grisea]|uniref:Uncharacterized protein n=1 Tax=Pyricularia grisea TaxID=148305 RepID=A0A6P8AS90_PYRGI|nr:uncharacterized protein PgNI_09517 [Pyricularia grisea]TLD04994.1 hypothetical protein PgNI_09517 [Pyricularia grisea]